MLFNTSGTSKTSLKIEEAKRLLAAELSTLKSFQIRKPDVDNTREAIVKRIRKRKKKKEIVM